jgi:hypothetical protein
MNVRDYVGLAVGGAVVYAIYKTLGPGSPGKQAADKVADAIAKPYVAFTNWLYGSYTTVPTGNVILPNGAKVPVAQLSHFMWDNTNNVASFVYNGYGYIIRPNPDGGPAYDANGDYHAE